MSFDEQKKFNFWQDHSVHYLEMAYKRDKIEWIENPHAHGKRTGECGDTIEIFLNIKNNHIQTVSFIINGCINTLACANTIALLAEGKTLSQAWAITVENVVDYLETLPSENIHCAELAVGAMYLALSDYTSRKDK